MSRLFEVTTTLYLARFDAEAEIVARACPGRRAPSCSNPDAAAFYDDGDPAECELEHVYVAPPEGGLLKDVAKTLTDAEREACETACVRRAEALCEPSPEPDPMDYEDDDPMDGEGGP